MTDEERREAARQFYYTWKDRGDEKSDSQSFWLNLLTDVLGMNDAANRVIFEKRVIVDGQTKFIDVFIPESRVLIEQKSLKKELSKEITQSGGTELTPYQQAKRYSDNLPFDEKPRWIIVSNFAEIRIHDMNTREPEKEYISIMLQDIQSEYHRLKFLLKEEEKIASKEVEISVQAGNIVGQIYDSLLEQYADKTNPESLKSLNKLCVRLVFCMYAEDSGLFGNHLMFHDYMQQYDAKSWRKALIDLFMVLDTKPENRDPYLEDDLAAFPYVNGGLFAEENIEIPRITDDIVSLILEKGCEFDWSEISPTIFGAVFESTLNPETRRSGGMHYTSIENIHKVIDPLFLDDLKSELEEIKNISILKQRKEKAKKFQDKLAGLTFLDPACGSGNFLTESYISLRKLENEAIIIQTNGQISLGDVMNPIQVSIGQFYGIEINDFAVTVGKTALWIAEHQMMKETESIIHMHINFLPLKSYANIIEGNALRMDWELVVPKFQLSYIMGNPPFVGARLMSKSQKFDIENCFSGKKGIGNLDYVSGWYRKAADYIYGTQIEAAFVSTNSISQGEQPALLWKEINAKGINITFAHRTFQWDSEANIKAHVHCVIIGFSAKAKKHTLYENGKKSDVQNINAYLVNAANVFIENRKKPICDVPEMVFGSMPNDNGKLSSFSKEEMEAIVKDYPDSKPLFKKFMGATEYINGKERYCLWLKDINPKLIQSIPPILKAVQEVKEIRESSNRSSTKKLAEFPHLFGEIRQPDTTYLIVPRHSSEKRTYIPLGYMSPDIICGDSNMLIPNATLYDFGIMTSNVHMAWMKAVCGRLEMRFRYSSTIVYNNFPWPTPTEEQRKTIETTAQMILDARANHNDCTMADMYSENMYLYTDLMQAHKKNDIAVMKAYGFNIKETNAESCVAALMNMYQSLTDTK